MTNDIEHGLSTVYDGIETMIDASYRERVELLEVLNEMTWFDNFGEPFYRRRLYLASRLAENVQDDDVPEFLAEELDGIDD